MSPTWRSSTPPPRVDIPLTGRIRAGFRGIALVILVFGGLLFLLFHRVFERPFSGVQRPVTPWITQGVCRGALWLLGIRLQVTGTPATGGGAMVANHGSWLDIFVLNAVNRVYFVSKDDVRSWPGIGWLARATGTLFIARDRRQAQAQTRLFADRLRAGHRLLFFPEGTSTDGQQVLPFKSTLFQAFLAPDIAPEAWVHPVSVRYIAPTGYDPRFYNWWGDMELAPHLLMLLAEAKPGAVHVTFQPPISVAEAGHRKVLAGQSEAAVRAGFDAKG